MNQDKDRFAPDAGYRMTETIHLRSLVPGKYMVILLLSLLSFPLRAAGPEETAKLVTAAIQNGNAGEVSKYFNAMVDLSVPGYDDTYSRTQAGQILKEFFSRYPIKSFKINKEGSSNDGSRYSIGELLTGQITYRVYFLIKPVGGQSLVQQLQIQEKN